MFLPHISRFIDYTFTSRRWPIHSLALTDVIRWIRLNIYLNITNCNEQVQKPVGIIGDGFLTTRENPGFLENDSSTAPNPLFQETQSMRAYYGSSRIKLTHTCVLIVLTLSNYLCLFLHLFFPQLEMFMCIKVKCWTNKWLKISGG